MAEGAIEVIAGVEGLRPEHGPLFAVIGVFDGIHLGHRYLLGRLVEEARRRGARPSVITFDSHPDEVLVGAAPPLLLDQAARLRMMGEAGVEVVVVQHFDAALRSTEYDDFVHRITSRTSLAGLLMTPDAAFGHDRRGTPDAVRALGDRDGFDLVVAPPFALDGRSVRSSDVRAAITAGDFDAAERLLGRPYAVLGEVGADGTLRFDMPVALPPAGSYPVSVSGEPAELLVDGNGTMRLAAEKASLRSQRVNVEFVARRDSA
jgi:riboflavin kinase/FMN adenylyltransferase